MAHYVICRVCRNKMDLDVMEKTEWTRPVKNYYYHSKCYEDWKRSKEDVKAEKSEIFWEECLIDYLYQDIKMSVDFAKFRSQWKLFTSPARSFTPKGIYFTMRYFYDVKKGDPSKAEGGIGIVSSIYNEAAQYWVDLENRKTGTIDAIIKQISERAARATVKKTQTTQTKPKSRWKLDDI